MVQITALKNGPYKVDGPIVIEDAGGQQKEINAGQSVSLCRCGASKNKPYCDGTHAKIGFKADK